MTRRKSLEEEKDYLVVDVRRTDFEVSSNAGGFQRMSREVDGTFDEALLFAGVRGYECLIQFWLSPEGGEGLPGCGCPQD
jgi:hypothetical protein